MKLLHIIGSLSTGGIQKLLMYMAQDSTSKQYGKNILCTISNEGSMKSEFNENNFKINFLPFKGIPNKNLPFKIDKQLRHFLSHFYFFKLFSYFLSSNYTVIHTHIHTHIISQILASVLSGKKIIWTIHGEYKLNKVTINIIQILQYICHNRLKITAVSKHALSSTLPFTLGSKIAMDIISNGIDLEQFSQIYNNNVVRKKYGYYSDEVIIGSIGRLVWEKGYDQVITLLNNFEFNEKTIKFIIAGDGNLKDQLIQKVNHLNLNNEIKFIGNIDNIVEFLNLLDIYIQPSIKEGFGLTVIEAMSIGLPIICSDAGGLNELITDGDNGLVYKSGNINELFESINKIVEMNDNEIRHIGFSAKNTVFSNYSIENTSKYYAKLYRE